MFTKSLTAVNPDSVEAARKATPHSYNAAFESGEFITIVGFDFGLVDYESVDGPKAYGRNVLKPSDSDVKSFLLTDKSSYKTVGNSTVADEGTGYIIVIQEFWRTFEYKYVDEEATSLMYHRLLAEGFSEDSILKKEPVWKRSFLLRNQWQNIFHSVWNDTSARLAEWASDKDHYISGGTNEIRCQRLVAFIGSRKLRLEKDGGPTGEGYLYTWRDKVSKEVSEYFRFRYFYSMDGLTDEDISSILIAAGVKKG